MMEQTLVFQGPVGLYVVHPHVSLCRFVDVQPPPVRRDLDPVGGAHLPLQQRNAAVRADHPELPPGIFPIRVGRVQDTRSGRNSQVVGLVHRLLMSKYLRDAFAFFYPQDVVPRVVRNVHVTQSIEYDPVAHRTFRQTGEQVGLPVAKDPDGPLLLVVARIDVSLGIVRRPLDPGGKGPLGQQIFTLTFLCRKRRNGQCARHQKYIPFHLFWFYVAIITPLLLSSAPAREQERNLTAAPPCGQKPPPGAQTRGAGARSGPCTS